MVQNGTADAFTRALQNADCETLIGNIREWFDKPYRNPTNALDIAVCVQSAVHSGFERKIDEARAAWRMGEATEWEGARRAFDAAMCAAVEAIGNSPNSEPQHDWTPPRQSKWGDPNKRPAIGAGWGQVTAAAN